MLILLIEAVELTWVFWSVCHIYTHESLLVTLSVDVNIIFALEDFRSVSFQYVSRCCVRRQARNLAENWNDVTPCDVGSIIQGSLGGCSSAAHADESTTKADDREKKESLWNVILSVTFARNMTSGLWILRIHTDKVGFYSRFANFYTLATWNPNFSTTREQKLHLS